MHLRKLYRTIETLASQSAENEEQILSNVIHAIIHSEAIKINGGRLWKIHPKTNSYLLKYQFRTYIAKIRYHNKLLYKYILALNTEHTDDTFLDTLNIISVSLTNVLKSRKIDKASEIQKSILPVHEIRFHPESFRDEIYGVSIPDWIVGGDFFDYLQTNDEKDRLGVVIGDAASKGLSAAAQALYVSGALRMGFGFQIKMNSLISKINNLLNRVFNEANFVTLFYAELTNDKRGLMIFTNAGHNNPILYRPAMDSFEFLETTGQILGPFLNEKYATESTLMGLSKPVMRTMKCLAKTD